MLVLMFAAVGIGIMGAELFFIWSAQDPMKVQMVVDQGITFFWMVVVPVMLIWIGVMMARRLMRPRPFFKRPSNPYI